MTSMAAGYILIGIVLGLAIAVSLVYVALRWAATRKWGGK